MTHQTQMLSGCYLQLHDAQIDNHTNIQHDSYYVLQYAVCTLIRYYIPQCNVLHSRYQSDLISKYFLVSLMYCLKCYILHTISLTIENSSQCLAYTVQRYTTSVT